ncbi:DUF4431 domain-containing protein [Paraburkholderia sp. J12]|uniref:DUF4431 domain-containing protein n=1 Tax=Paraburkholderia sp. J12 TaxID=2805432 RepID=UPI002ABDE82B|nr:DUF4431 domain-containing protein [Paraburkholderia sp. J12]
MNAKRLVAAVVLLCMSVAGRGTESAPPITLEGTLLVGDFYGPPGYGENPDQDRIEHALYLQLPATPEMQVGDSGALASFDAEAQRTYFVQVVPDGPDRSAMENAIGHKVEVRGVPLVPVTGHHRTPLLIDVKSFKPIDAWHW